MQVLLAEDNPGDVLMFQEAIRMSEVNADVLVAQDGEQVLWFLKESEIKPDVVFLDLNLPRLSGLQVLECSNVAETAAVVILSSSANPSDMKLALELGAKEYIVKPTDLDDFMTVVKDALERWTR